ncbi:hypothetical protein T484DRAFT_1615499, partial [Baffinella frigidus]
EEPTPYTLNPKPCTQNPTPETLHPKPKTQNPTPKILHPKPYIQNPTPETLHPKPYTMPAGLPLNYALQLEPPPFLYSFFFFFFFFFITISFFFLISFLSYPSRRLFSCLRMQQERDFSQPFTTIFINSENVGGVAILTLCPTSSTLFR